MTYNAPTLLTHANRKLKSTGVHVVSLEPGRDLATYYPSGNLRLILGDSHLTKDLVSGWKGIKC